MKQPATYLYPAVFTFEDGQISITFPDLPGCVSCADTEAEVVANARGCNMKVYGFIMRM